jgi:hypothetical protein
MKKGWTREQSAGIAANLWAESGFNHNAVGDSGSAFGLAQWHKDRAQNFKKVFGRPLVGSTKHQQWDFVDWELRNTEKKAGYLLKGATTAKDAGSAMVQFERPKDRIGAMFQRGQLARKLYAETYDNKGKSFAGGNNGGTTVNIANNTVNANNFDELGKQINKAVKPRMSNNYSFAGQQ